MNSKELQQLLSGVVLFEGMSKRAISRVVASGKTTKHADGREVIAEGSGAIGFHLITKGSAKVTSGGSTRRTLSIGDYFGEISVIDGKPRSSSVVADGPLETFMIEATSMHILLEEQPQFTMHLLQVLCGRLREAEARG